MQKELKNILSALKPLCHDAQKYNAFMEYLEHKIQLEQKRLENLSDPIQIHRSQGKIQSFRALMMLREEVLAGE